jgi:hypothetical protein
MMWSSAGYGAWSAMIWYHTLGQRTNVHHHSNIEHATNITLSDLKILCLSSSYICTCNKNNNRNRLLMHHVPWLWSMISNDVIVRWLRSMISNDMISHIPWL